ncbi:MAG: uroporphyrinogen-III C-methyltransferase [Acidobacteriia bacterium]|nr:uroporphyrinogen-III C-methyltransferase [Terriglobia bacterium]
MKTMVYLVGAGPGDPELLTVKALRALREADVVLHDDLVGPEILKLVPATANVQNVGKRYGRNHITQDQINSLMVNFAMAGLTVVRLKAGDPLIFGRAGEEIEALRRAQICFEIIPGITAALGAAAAAQIPLTHRQLASRLILLTGHRALGARDDWRSLISADATLVLYMPGEDYSEIASQLQAAGLHRTTPCALISQTTTAAQQIHQTTIGELPEVAPLASPALLIVGAVAEFATQTLSPQLGQSELINCWAQI